MSLLFDSSVIIIGFKERVSNSALLLDMVLDLRLGRPYISEKVIEEVTRYFRARIGRKHAFLVERLLHRNFEVVPRRDLLPLLRELKGRIKDKDLEHLAAARKVGATYIIAFDRDFEGIAEYRTPKQIIDMMGADGYPSDY